MQCGRYQNFTNNENYKYKTGIKQQKREMIEICSIFSFIFCFFNKIKYGSVNLNRRIRIHIHMVSLFVL